ncbi:MAG: MaoC family dehydratase N-terminal domain-containing protein [Chloroflexi bacterium]|nr:MaoC family dehydratase N-terminal domain-containing protein [Chloroflexota bacterium]
MVLEHGRMTDEGIASLRSRTGSYYRIDPYNDVATKDAIRNCATAIGDYRNPLWRDEEYGARTRYRSMIAPPWFFYCVSNITGMRAGGLPGVHAFHSGTDWLLLASAKLNDTISPSYRPIDVVEKRSEFAGRSLIVYAEGAYTNQRGDVVAKAIGWSIRVERSAAKDKGKYSGIKVHSYTPEELERIREDRHNEQVRGAVPRYWEDVQIGEELTPIVKGPLNTSDMLAWQTGALGGESHGFAIRHFRRHPAWSYRDPKTGARDAIAQVHEQDSTAGGIAIPAAYDLGAQRNSWIMQVMTNWVGDDGWLKAVICEYRRFNLYGDTQWIKGKVTGKLIKDGEHLVQCDVWAENQRGEVTAPAQAMAVLPSRRRVSSAS